MRGYQPLHEILSQPRRSNAASTLSSLQCPEAEGGLLEDQKRNPQQGNLFNFGRKMDAAMRLFLKIN
jgi:hypothetical protein